MSHAASAFGVLLLVLGCILAGLAYPAFRADSAHAPDDLMDVAVAVGVGVARSCDSVVTPTSYRPPLYGGGGSIALGETGETWVHRSCVQARRDARPDRVCVVCSDLLAMKPERQNP